MAEQLYLAVEHRCDINNLHVGSDQNVYLDMKNEQAELWLRQNVVSWFSRALKSPENLKIVRYP